MSKRLCTLIILACLLTQVSVVVGEDSPISIDPLQSEIGPKEAHQWLWENNLKPRLIKKQKQELELALDKSDKTNWQEYDMRFYSLDLTIDHTIETVYGRVAAHGTIEIASLDSIKINLANSMTVDSIYNETGLLAFNHASEQLTVQLDKAYTFGEEYNFTIVYHGVPAGSSGFLGMDFSTRNGLPLITTLSEPMGARSWWPCNDIPRDKVDSVHIIITVDTSLVVSSNGTLMSDSDNGDGTHTVVWHELYPITPYLVSLGIHPYAIWYDWYHYGPTDSMPLHYYVYPDHDATSRPHFAVMPDILTNLSAAFGQYPFIDEKYGCTHFDWGGAMEHQTNTSTSSSSFGYSEPVIAHEAGHQWWGDMVTTDDWHHIWINEGFAVYSEAVHFEAKNGTAYYHDYMNSFEYSGGGSIYIDDTTWVWNIFSAIVYDKGGWTLHMLRHVVGDDLFFESLANYRDQYVWLSATTEDFQGVVEATAGMDLEYFFDQWIYGTYRPYYRHSFVSEPDPSGGYFTYLHLRQIQATNPTFFTMPVDLYLMTPGGTVYEVIFNDKQNQNFTFHTDDEVTSIILDPNRWISRLEGTETYRLHIVNESLSDGAQAVEYADTVKVKGGNDNFLCEVISGAMPSGWNLEAATGIISGTSYEAGQFTFIVKAVDQTYSGYYDSVEYSVNLSLAPGFPGNANADDLVNVGDAVYMISFVFKGGDPPPISNWGDANGDCGLNVGDAVYLINYVFKNGDAPVPGCVE